MGQHIVITYVHHMVAIVSLWPLGVKLLHCNVPGRMGEICRNHIHRDHIH